MLEQGTFDHLINSNGEVSRLLKGVASSKRNLKEEPSASDGATVQSHAK